MKMKQTELPKSLSGKRFDKLNLVENTERVLEDVQLQLGGFRQQSSNIRQDPRRNPKCGIEFIRKIGIWYFQSEWCQLFMIVCAVFACLSYILEAYSIYGSTVERYLEVALFCCFLLDYFLSIATAANALNYIFSTNGMIDLISLLPIVSFFYVSDSSSFQFNFLRALRAVKVLRILRILRIFSMKFDVVTKYEVDAVEIRILSLLISMVGIVFISTGAVFSLHQFYLNRSESTFSQAEIDEMCSGNYAISKFAFTSCEIQWHDALYFVFVTVSTVGYGDINPLHMYARLVMLLTITCFLFIVPLEFNLLLDALQSRTKYRAAYSENRFRRHIVLTGDVNAEMIGMLLDEFYHERLSGHSNHGKQDKKSLKIVIVQNKNPPADLEHLMHSHRYRRLIHYIRGSLCNPTDLQKANVEQAEGVLIFVDYSEPVDLELSILEAMGAQKHLRRHGADMKKNVIVQVSTNRAKDIVGNSEYCQVINVNELKLEIMAVATFCNGFISFLLALTQSEIKGYPQSTKQEDIEETFWQDEFIQGARYSLYTVDILDISKKVEKLRNFKAAAVYSKEHFGVVLVAVSVVAGKDSEIKVILFPDTENKNFQFEEVQAVFVIALSQVHAEFAIAKLPEKYEDLSSLGNQRKDQSDPRSIRSSGVTAVHHQGIQKIISPNPRALLFPNPKIQSFGQEFGDEIPKHIFFLSEKHATESLKQISGVIDKCYSDFDLKDESQACNATNKSILEIEKTIKANNTNAPQTLSKHLVLIGQLEHAEVFITKVKHCSPDTEIVILAPSFAQFQSLKNRLENAANGKQSYFESLYFVIGEVTSKTLRQCGLNQAWSVVLIGGGSSSTKDDKDTVSKLVRIEYELKDTMYSHVLVITELVSEASLYFLKQGVAESMQSSSKVLIRNNQTIQEIAENNAKQESKKYQHNKSVYLWPVVATGSVFPQSFLDIITMRLHFSKFELSFWETLLRSAKDSRNLDHKYGKHAQGAANVPQCHGCFCQIEVPPDCRRMNYGELFQHLVFKYNCIPMGIYRDTLHNDAPLPYSFVNPSNDTTISQQHDKIFVVVAQNKVDDFFGKNSQWTRGKTFQTFWKNVACEEEEKSI